MLLELYPRVHRRYTSLAVIGPILDGYGTWLLKQGYSDRSRPRAFSVRRRASSTVYSSAACGALTSLTRARLWGCAPHGFAGGSQFGGPGAAACRGIASRSCRCIRRPALTRIEQRVAAYRAHLQQVRGFAPVDRGAPRPHGRRVSGPHRLRNAPDAARRARPPGSGHLSVRGRPPPVACDPPACGGPPPSLPPVPGVCRRDPDRARHADRHASRVSRREAPTGATLGHGSGVPPGDRAHEPAGAPRLRDLPPHGHLWPARVRGRGAHDRRCGVAGEAAAHPATEDTRLALAPAHRRGRDRAARLPASRTRRPERAPAARPVPRRAAAHLSGAVSSLPHAETGVLKPTAVTEAFQAWSKRSGLAIPFQGAHCVRHSYAVHLLRSGLSLKTIGDLLGHRTLESTCVYLRLAVDDLRDVALALPAAVDRSTPGVAP